MDVPKSLLVQTLTAATLSFPSIHVDQCISCLAFTLEHAGFENIEPSVNVSFGTAFEFDRGAHHHVALVLILAADAYETTSDEIEAYAHMLMDADDNLNELVDELDGSLLDIVSVCLDPIQGRCRIHHPQDILHTCNELEAPVHFFIPAGSDTVVPADECPMELRMAPLALANVACA